MTVGGRGGVDPLDYLPWPHTAVERATVLMVLTVRAGAVAAKSIRTAGSRLRASWGGGQTDVSCGGFMAVMVHIVVCRVDTVQSGTGVPTFRSNIQPPSSGLKIEALLSSETLVTTYETPRCHNPEDQNTNKFNNIRTLNCLQC